jgi:hypothetical protein
MKLLDNSVVSRTSLELVARWQNSVAKGQDSGPLRSDNATMENIDLKDLPPPIPPERPKHRRGRMGLIVLGVVIAVLMVLGVGVGIGVGIGSSQTTTYTQYVPQHPQPQYWTCGSHGNMTGCYSN